MASGDILDLIPSESPSDLGAPVVITGTAIGAATTIHTHDSSASVDHLWLWAANTDAVTREITLLVGGATTAHVAAYVSLAAKGAPTLLCENLKITGGLSVSAFADSASKVNVWGRVDRYMT